MYGSKTHDYDGRPQNTSSYTLNLLKYKIVEIYLNSGHFLDSIQFKLKDKNSSDISYSPTLGRKGGRFYKINSKSIFGFKKVTRIFGTTTNLKNIRSIAFEHTTSNKYGKKNILIKIKGKNNLII